MNNNHHDEECELIQMSISDSIESNTLLSEEEQAHIQQCPECHTFYKMWQKDSSLSEIASGPLSHSKSISAPIISLLSETPKPISKITQQISFLRLTTIAASIAFISALTFLLFNKNTHENIPSSTIVTHIEEPPSDKIASSAGINIILTQEEIEQSLEKNYSELSKAATNTWQSATNSISRATEYLTEGPKYLSTKFLSPSKDQTMKAPTPLQSTDQQAS